MKDFRGNRLIEFLDELIKSEGLISLSEIYDAVYNEFGEDACEPDKLCPHYKRPEPEYKHTIRLTLWDGRRKRDFITDNEGNWSIKGVKSIAESVSEINYTEEFSGKITYEKSSQISANYYHGEIVNQLKEELESKGFVVGNDDQRDLFIVDDQSSIESLFEIKTDMSTDSVYKGVGQLLMYSLLLTTKPRLILVLPGIFKNEEITEKMKTDLGIHLLAYEKTNEKEINFKNLMNLFYL